MIREPQFYYKLFAPFLDTDHSANSTTDAVLEILNHNQSQLESSLRVGSEIHPDLLFYEGMNFCFYQTDSMPFWPKFAELLGAKIVDSPNTRNTHTFALPKYIKKFKTEYPRVTLYKPDYFIDNLLFVDEKDSIFPIKNFKYVK